MTAVAELQAFDMVSVAVRSGLVTAFLNKSATLRDSN